MAERPLLTGAQLLVLLAVRKLMAETGRAVPVRSVRLAVSRATGRNFDRSNLVRSAKIMEEKGWLEATAGLADDAWQTRVELKVTAKGEREILDMLRAIEGLRGKG